MSDSVLTAVVDSTWSIALAAAVVLLIVWKCATGSAPPPPAPVIRKPKPQPRDFTRAQLANFDGRIEKQILIGVLGRVYDVTPGADFYGPGGTYEAFAGKDATMALARDSIETTDLLDNSQLKSHELARAREWQSFFEGKYDFVGTLVDAIHPAQPTRPLSSTAAAAAPADGKQS